MFSKIFRNNLSVKLTPENHLQLYAFLVNIRAAIELVALQGTLSPRAKSIIALTHQQNAQ